MKRFDCSIYNVKIDIGLNSFDQFIQLFDIVEVGTVKFCFNRSFSFSKIVDFVLDVVQCDTEICFCCATDEFSLKVVVSEHVVWKYKSEIHILWRSTISDVSSKSFLVYSISVQFFICTAVLI